MCQIASLTIFKVNIIQPTQQNQVVTFLHRLIAIYVPHECSTKKIPEIEIVFVSDLTDITQKQYLEQPKSMLCRKLIRNFHETTSQDFEYIWSPDFFKIL